MNMLARIPETLLEREPKVHLVLLDTPPPAAAPAPAEPKPAVYRPARAPSAAEEAAFALLDREERLEILLSRGTGRLRVLAGSWVASLDRILPAPSPDGALARERAARFAALRRYAVLHRLERGGLAFEEEARLIHAGYTEAQAEVIRALVERFDDGWTRPNAAWRRVAGWFAIACGGGWLLDRWLAAGVDDPYVALLLAIVITAGMVSFLAVSAHPAGRRGRRA